MSTSGSVEDVATIVTRLSKELELMGLPGLAISYEDSDGAVVDVIGLINAAYDLINLLRQLQRSKRQREDHAQQLLHDLQRSQWLLDKEKEQNSQREREAAEACEKERQSNVRLQLVETILKKKTDEHRQLLHECQLKENQWLHAVRRRDQDNEKLHQQLLKLLRNKSGGGTGMIPLEVEIRGSLAPRIGLAGAVSRPLAEVGSPTRRKQWDRTGEDSQRLVEVKWKMALNSLEKDHQLLKADYVQLVEMVARFLVNCSTKIPNPTETNPFTNLTEWIQLPSASMSSRLEDVFQLVENRFFSVVSFQNQSEKRSETFQVMKENDDSHLFESLATNAIVGQLKQSTLEENQVPAVNDFLNPMMKVDDIIVTPQNRTHTRSTHQPSESVKSIHPVEPARAHRPSDVTDPWLMMRQPAKSSQPLEAANQINWNEMKTNDLLPFETDFTGQSSVFFRKSASQITPMSQNLPVLSTDQDDGQRLINSDTPCPSGSNSRRASSGSSTSSSTSSRSSSSSSCSSKSQSAMDVKDQLVEKKKRERRQFTTSTVNLNNRTSITAKVSFVQQPASHDGPSTSHLTVDPIDLQCFVTRHLMSPSDTQ